MTDEQFAVVRERVRILWSEREQRIAPFGRNGGVICDTDIGPCACGATHHEGEKMMQDTPADFTNDIREMRRIAEQQLAVAQHGVREAQIKLSLVHDLCEHPNAVVGSHQGERCRHCPDCGGHDI